ncbi:ExbD/TolR family protein [Synoicihabitans lomoniglobus]|uniref:Biopolymer transporter ExbD n=1 Tax=Synoicihabitans lomoniglobus TaxID=2909285 RepID=A0AAF0I770_9BACT|nr:biopolymer transporter ExbD [Opitutaceae bacterium LMO-M01]WED66526.1 biopolymer transporter ExbD [Opitutaceae bacterium LMO-M01]
MHGTPLPDLDAAPEKRARIEIIPLIDVIFFLLATFVLFTLSLDRTGVIPLILPKVEVTPPPVFVPPVEPVMIQVSDQRNYYWDQEQISFELVRNRLADYATKAEAKVMLTSDDRANYGDTIRLLDAVRAAGITEVSIETRFRPTGR